MDKVKALAAGDVSETVLWHPERADIAIACVVILVLMVRFVISFVHEHGFFEMPYIMLCLGVSFFSVPSILVWSLGVATVVRKDSEDLTISWKLGGLLCGRLRSVPLKDVSDMVARERTYGVKGRKIRRFEILFGPVRGRTVLLGRLTRDHVIRLRNGVLQGMLTYEGSMHG